MGMQECRGVGAYIVTGAWALMWFKVCEGKLMLDVVYI